MSTLREIFLSELSAIYSSETQLVKAMPKLAEAATDPDLREALETHHSETEDQVARLEKLFEELHLTPKRRKNKSLDALIEEGLELAGEGGDPGLVAMAQRIEHYEIACYQSSIAWARALEEDEALSVLEEILEEEELTNEKLTEIADASVIPDAAREDEASEDEQQEQGSV